MLPNTSTALISSPRLRAYLTASKTSSSVPGSSPGAPVPKPAATMSGVLKSSLVSCGSAPKSTNKRIKSTSAVRAARRKAVPPRMLRSLTPTGGRLVTFAFISAPDSTSFFVNSKLPIFPEPWGAGLLDPACPALRIQVI